MSCLFKFDWSGTLKCMLGKKKEKKKEPEDDGNLLSCNIADFGVTACVLMGVLLWVSETF